MDGPGCRGVGVSERVFSEYEKKITLWGVAIVFLLSALDQTIV